MATDAIVVEHTENIVLTSSPQTIVQLAPLQPGGSYAIWAHGSISCSNSNVVFELEAFGGAKDRREISFNEHHGEVSFSLVVATTLPADDELFTVAKLSGSSRAFVGSDATGLAVVKNAKLVVLAVDSVAVQQA